MKNPQQRKRQLFGTYEKEWLRKVKVVVQNFNQMEMSISVP